MVDTSLAQTVTKTASVGQAPVRAKADDAGAGDIAKMGTAWIEAMGEFNTEMSNFLAERIKHDVTTQREILQCKNIAEVQRVQGQFLQDAMQQYSDETGKLVEIGMKAFGPQKKEKSSAA